MNETTVDDSTFIGACAAMAKRARELAATCGEQSRTSANIAEALAYDLMEAYCISIAYALEMRANE